MPCYKPLVFSQYGLKENGKKNIVLERNFTGNYDDYMSDRFLFVPCGKCLGCKLDYARIWAERCTLEASQYTDNMFLTLTYDDDHVPDICSKKDFQLFIKRLRNHFNDRNIRFFGCCERGSGTNRPHMHIIIFNAKFNDLKQLKRSGDHWLYTSSTLEKLWPYGFSTIGDADYNSINYTARYVLKKVNCNKSDEFLLMSRRPGIGYDYLMKNIDKIKDNELIYFPFNDTKKQTHLSRYYKELIKIDDPNFFEDKKKEMLEAIKQKNISEKQKYNIDNQLDLYNIQHKLKIYQIKNLKRGL